MTAWASETYGVDLTVDGINEFAGRLSELGFLETGGPSRRSRTTRRPAVGHQSAPTGLDNAEAGVDVDRGREDRDVRPRPGDARFARRADAGRARFRCWTRRRAAARRRAHGRSDAAARRGQPAARRGTPVRHPVAAPRTRRATPVDVPAASSRRRRPARPRIPARPANAPAKPAFDLGDGPRRHAAVAPARRARRSRGARACHGGHDREDAAAARAWTPAIAGQRARAARRRGPGAARPARAPPAARARRRADGRVLDGRRRGGGQTEAARTGRVISDRSSCCWRSRGIAYVAWSAASTHAFPQARARARAVAQAGRGLPLVLRAAATVTDHEARTLAFDSAGTLAELLPPGTAFVAGDILGRLRGAAPIEALLARQRARLAFYQQMRESMRTANNQPELRQAEIQLAEKQRLIDETNASLAKLVVRAGEPGEVVETLAKVGMLGRRRTRRSCA